MNNMSGSATSRSKRPHGIGQGVDVRMVWPSAVLDEIDQWAAAQPHKPGRSEAILRLVQQALACTPEKQPASRFVDALARVLLPEGNAEGIGVEVGQMRSEARWKPRLVEPTHSPPPSAQVSPAVMSAPTPVAVTPEPQPIVNPAEGNEPYAMPEDAAEDNRPYAMPEDVKAFNHYWRRAEHLLGRHLEYEEVVVSYNRCREAYSVGWYSQHLVDSFD